jgi:predicted nucleic acid-binding protein
VIIVDSDILVFHLRGYRSSVAWLLTVSRMQRLAVSAVTVLEVGGGMRSSERREVVRLMSQLDVLPVTERIAWQAAAFNREYRRSHGGISQADYLIVAKAETHGATVATLNVRHFPMFPDLAPPFAL